MMMKTMKILIMTIISVSIFFTSITHDYNAIKLTVFFLSTG